ncbi:MAG: hypothetical protein L0H53_14260 [Candidatus Nitrosocosmicus sp.]|nr:hypothetical protein [Candidatus Nitrosocosmicus sp.]
MQSHKPGFTLGYTTNNFVNAFDEYKERNRKLFDVPDIDGYLSFEDKKNICIANNSSSNIATNFLYSIIANACINYHLIDDKTRPCNNYFENKTILIDAGNGNNLGYLYLEIVKKSSSGAFDIKEMLDQIIIVRAFTFYQLLNIIIHEVPKFIHQFDGNCKIQIIVMDFLDTSFESSHTIRTKDKHNYQRSERDFKHNEKLVIEAIDTLLDLSNNHYVILSYYNNNGLVNGSLFSKFSNYLEIDLMTRHDIWSKNRKNIHETKDTQNELLIKIKSKKSISHAIFAHKDICDNNHKSTSKDRVSTFSSNN